MPLASRSDVKVLPDPDGPKIASLSLDWTFVALVNS